MAEYMLLIPVLVSLTVYHSNNHRLVHLFQKKKIYITRFWRLKIYWKITVHSHPSPRTKKKKKNNNKSFTEFKVTFTFMLGEPIPIVLPEWLWGDDSAKSSTFEMALEDDRAEWSDPLLSPTTCVALPAMGDTGKLTRRFNSRSEDCNVNIIM